MADEQSIANMTGDECLKYLNTLSLKQAEYSKLRISLLEKLKPIERQRADLRADLQKVLEEQRQTKIEIAACKYAINAEKG